METVLSDKPDLTQLLRKGAAGDREAFDQVIHVVYDELRRIARRQMSLQRPGHTMQPTEMVHAAYLRLVSRSQSDWRDRVHFLNVAATMMRQILVDHARSKCAIKRGGQGKRIEFNESLNYSNERASDLVAVDDALMDLASVDERKARALELKYFGGLSVDEIAAIMGHSTATVGRDIRVAEAWLRRRLEA